MSNSIRLNLFLALGTSDHDEVIMVDSFFKHKDGMQGCTGSQFSYLSEDCIEAENETDYLKENYDYLWEESVASGKFKGSLDEYIENFKQEIEHNYDGLSIHHDTSYLGDLEENEKFLKWAKEKYKFNGDFYDQETGTFSCIGGGRMFGDDTKINHYFDDLYASVLELIKGFENEEFSIDYVQNQLDVLGIEYKTEIK